MSEEINNFLVQSEIDRLTPGEKVQLQDEMEIGRTTLYNWMQDPSNVKPANKLYITTFINNKLRRSYTVEDLFDEEI